VRVEELQPDINALKQFILDYARLPHGYEIVKKNGFNSATLRAHNITPNKLLVYLIQGLEAQDDRR